MTTIISRPSPPCLVVRISRIRLARIIVKIADALMTIAENLTPEGLRRWPPHPPIAAQFFEQANGSRWSDSRKRPARIRRWAVLTSGPLGREASTVSL